VCSLLVGFNPFSPTLFLIVAKMSIPKRSAPYWSNPPFLFFYFRDSGLPYKSGTQNHPFRRLRNLTATLVAYIFGIKHDINNWASAFAARRGLLHCLYTTQTLVHKRLKIGLLFLPTLRRSANGTQHSTKRYLRVDST